MAMLEVRLLGELEVEFDGIAITLPTSRRACALLAWLALRPGPHSRSRLASLLWPDVLDASARASLRSALWALRAAFGPTAGEYLQAGRDYVELAGEGLGVDARELERLLAAGCPREAVALHRGDLLSQFDADWVLDARDEHRDRLCGAHALLAAAAEADGQLATARDWAARRVAARPLDEQAARELIRLLVLPAAPVADAGNGAGRLVGRGGEVRALLRHWRASRAGSGTAVAISGDGGMGKTRLAREVLDVAAADGALTAAAAAGGPGAVKP